MATITSKNSAFVEITDRCYGSCPWCYKKDVVHSRGKHVPLDLIIVRIDWINEYVQCDQILPIGGEPLLHPNFIEICDHILSLGKKVSIVTAGLISSLKIEKKNLDYALDLYEKGLLTNFNLSLQPGINDKEYLSILKRIIALYPKQREVRDDQGLYHILDHDLFTTVVINRSFLGNKQKLLDLINFVTASSGYKEYALGDKEFEDIYTHLEAHFADFGNSHDLNTTIYPLDESTGFRHKIFIKGETIITQVAGVNNVQVPQGGMCEALKIKVEHGTISVNGLMVRSEGEVCIPTPQCIPVKSGLCNADIHTGEAVFETVKKSIAQIHKLVYLANRRKASANCKPDGTEEDCTACPFDDMCNTCHAIVRKWK